ncbi:MAG: Hint domain-containing protein, partial [Candidatus Paceibacterota bacterium]
ELGIGGPTSARGAAAKGFGIQDEKAAKGSKGTAIVLGMGFYLSESFSNNLSENHADYNPYGFSSLSSDNNAFSNNTANNNTETGFYLSESRDNTFEDNSAKENGEGEYSSSDNSIGNTVIDLDVGVSNISFESTDIAIKNTTSPASDPSAWDNIGMFFSILDNSDGSWISINASYNESAVSSEANLSMLEYDSSWAEIGTAGVNEAEDYVYSGNVTSFSTFAPMVYTGTSACFLAGTEILMADGSEKAIEKLRAGEKIASYDENTGSVKTGTIEKTFRHLVSGYLIINSNLKVTDIHPIFVEGKWKKAGELKIGDKIKTLTGYETVHSIEKIPDSALVYNLQVDYSTYYAESYLVHNKGGGGGGGGGDAKPKANATVVNKTIATPVDLGEIKQYSAQGAEKNISANQEIRFTLDSAQHMLVVRELHGVYATIELSSKIITANISVGETKEFDIDGDGENDIAVELKEITGSNAAISIEYIEKPAVPPYVPPAPVIEESGNGIMGIIVSSIAAIAFITIIIYLAHRKGMRKYR